MPALETPIADLNAKAADFRLKGIDGKTYSLQGVKGPKGTLIMFICNHCPFVQAITDRLVSDMKELQALGVGVCAIMSNDTENYPQDSFANMKEFAARHGFTFPYLIDESQAVAKAYGAVCTPDFFGYNSNLALRYRGRLDDSRMESKLGVRRDLLEAMKQIAQTGKGPKEQHRSIGCSIKWRTEA